MSTAPLLPPPIEQLERTDSKPSLTHTHTTATTLDSPPLLRSTSDLHSPGGLGMDIKIQREDSRSDEEIRKPFAKINLSKSMQGLRGKYKEKEKDVVKPKSGLGRQRAMSFEAKKPPPSPVKSKQHDLPATSASRPSRPQPTRSSSGFSSFIRKLTGRATSPPKAKGVDSERLIPSPAKRPVHGEARPPAPVRPTAHRNTTSPALAVVAPKPALRKIDTLVVTSDRFAPASAPAAPQGYAILPGPTPLSPARPPSTIDPCEIPLPPSPGTTPLEVIEPVSNFTLAPPVSSAPAPRPKKVKQSGMLSLEGFEFEMDDVDEEEEEEEEERLRDEDEVEERADTVKALQPIRIPNRVAPGQLATPTTPSTIANEIIVTPTSTHGESPSRYEHMKLAGSSPPHKAPIGTGFDLGRKESKWRKSVMGLSETLNKQSSTASSSKSVARRTSQKPPPTSYDSYVAHQKRIAANRTSCAPTIHSTASVAAEAREIADKEQQDMADTFFLS